MFRGKVSIIKQIADSPALFTAGAMNVHILEILNMIKAASVEMISPPLVCLRVQLHYNEDINPTQPTPGSRQRANPVHRLCIITGNDWSSHFTRQD